MHSELLARLEAATGTDAHLGEAVLLACGWKKTSHGYFMGQLWGWSSPDGKTYCDHDHFRRIDPTASIDAALTLVPEGCEWSIDTLDGVPEAIVAPFGPIDQNPTKAATPALAICIAALRAIEARQQ